MARAIYSCTIEGKLISVEANDLNEALAKFKTLYPSEEIVREDLEIISLKKLKGKKPSEIIAGFRKI